MKETIGRNSSDPVYDYDGDGYIKICGDLDVKGDLTLAPGKYIISDGDFKVNSGAHITGSDVTIILTGSSKTKMADININGSADVNLSATTDGSEWDGVLFFQDPSGSQNSSTIAGGANLSMDGIVYLPNGDVSFTGNAGQYADCLLLVASTVDFGGESKFDYDSTACPFDTSAFDTSAKVIRVVE